MLDFSIDTRWTHNKKKKYSFKNILVWNHAWYVINITNLYEIRSQKSNYNYIGKPIQSIYPSSVVRVVPIDRQRQVGAHPHRCIRLLWHPLMMMIRLSALTIRAPPWASTTRNALLSNCGWITVNWMGNGINQLCGTRSRSIWSCTIFDCCLDSSRSMVRRDDRE